jgi:hypothetical protein
VDESLPSEFLLTLYLTLRGFGRAKAFKNPVNAGENRGKPVVGIGRFNSMNALKIADLLRKSTSLGKPLPPSITRFT